MELKIKKSAVAICLAMAATAASAQQLHGSITVEGDYKPDIIERDRIYTMPQTVARSLTQSLPAYAREGVVARFQPSFMPLKALPYKASRSIDRSRGYLDVAMGSWLQSNLSAGYRFVDNGSTTIGAMLQFNSTSLFKPYEDSDVKRRMYDGTLGVYGSHTVEGVAGFDASLYYRHADFNYYGAAVSGADPSQSINAVDFCASASALPERVWQWNGTFKVGYFGFGNAWMPDLAPAAGLLNPGGEKETRLQLAGGVNRDISEVSAVGMDVVGDMMMYGAPDGMTSVDNYGNLSLRPAYTYRKGSFTARVGLNAELTFNAYSGAEKFKTFHIAPDVSVRYAAGIVGFSLAAGGGNRLQGFGELQNLDYYCMPWIVRTAPVWTPWDVQGKVTVGPLSGISFGIHGGWRSERNRDLGGLYMSSLAQGTMPEEGAIDINGWTVGLDASADIASIVKLTGNCDYQHQNGTAGYFNGYDRPRWIVDAAAEVTPLQRLALRLGYEYRGVRRIYAADVLGLKATRLPDLALLNLAGRYGITDKITVHGRLDVPFGSQRLALPFQPLGGVNFTVGVSVRF